MAKRILYLQCIRSEREFVHIPRERLEQSQVLHFLVYLCTLTNIVIAAKRAAENRAHLFEYKILGPLSSFE